ncbi:GTPase-activating Rap/Ran-GAP domain-like protein 3 [Collichthys lucidus]|uniref:GTPase-activating Rap/Ran-GAP domain-like protein 3 n=1 Tax=Collichthys lucidus TaxID=240159 RepID=A0A4U5VCX5_COLLU|nr:GTPase-activating Rap/Ran-GAP domain-like protein 3 [Collichthys lucidus]
MNSVDPASNKLLTFNQRSASEDLGCRRGDFSRKHYGSVELLISSDADGAIQRAGRFRVENGSSDETLDYTPGTWRRTDVHLENPEYHTRWFFKYFLGKGQCCLAVLCLKKTKHMNTWSTCEKRERNMQGVRLRERL